MRKNIILLSLFLLIAAVTAAFNYSGRQNISEMDNLSPTSADSISTLAEIPITDTEPVVDGDFTVSSIVARDSDKVELYENFDEKLSASDAKKIYSCDHILSGGFYSEENEHLGLLIKDGKILQEANKSELFNGFFSININEDALISYSEPTLSNTRLGFQSGPMLIENGNPLHLEIKNDENARRIVAALNPQNHIIFLVVYLKSSPLSGPKLAELPKVINRLEKGTNFRFTHALNLDGGSHSAFISGNTKLNEIIRSGTFICIKP